uniref:Uncharacterized protein n=1 Tax=Anguilla anguilla TaxID=7936 RepID=A0A0E9PJW6_ANGAN
MVVFMRPQLSGLRGPLTVRTSKEGSGISMSIFYCSPSRKAERSWGPAEENR